MTAMMRLLAILLLVMAVQTSSFGADSVPSRAAGTAHTFAIGDNDFLLDGQRFQIRCGEIHATRVPREYWRHRLRMCKAMGLNTVCAYLFWNRNEPRPGVFDWEGNADLPEFCRMAQQEGLWVLLRPGPYVCAEWDMGGLPWWLLKKPDVALRTRDSFYLDHAVAWLKEVGRVFGPLQVTRGGPILMVQVENEYGSYGKDAQYMGVLRQAMIDAGFMVPLFACDPPHALRNGLRGDLFNVVNFGSDPAGAFKALRAIQPRGPLMCGEFYPGWFDTWSSPHHKGSTASVVLDLDYMLAHDASFSLYMAHGGTTFGLWSGTDNPFKPDTSSYDYDAPISESGLATEKFYAVREVMKKYLLPGETLPEPPAANPVIEIPRFTLTECAPVYDNLPAPTEDPAPGTMEQHDQAHGCILYRTTLPAGPAASLEAPEVHDFGWVSVDGKPVGVFDRRSHRFRVVLPAREKPARLDILVEAMGRVNFGPGVHDRKGLHAPVRLMPETGSPISLTGWQVFPLPLDQAMLDGLRYGPGKPAGPAFWRGTFSLDTPGDTFLDLRTWGKGVAWVNGHCLGRFWNIGPTQAMYLPGPWLKKGRNEVIVLDLIGPQAPELAGLARPILDQLRPELDFARRKRDGAKPHLEGVAPIASGTFAPGADVQDVRFDHPVDARQVCLESLSAHDGKPFAAVAELDVLDDDGKPLPHTFWTVAYADSEERAKEDGSADNAIDGQAASFWHTRWSGPNPPGHPHALVIDLGRTTRITGIRYLPRPGGGNVGGRIKAYRLYASTSPLATRPAP
jgi:beta-galactosidase